MAFKPTARQTGMLNSLDLAFLSRVMSQAVTASDSEEDRARRAHAAITLFRSGVTDEAVLVSMVSERLFTIEVEQASGSAR